MFFKKTILVISFLAIFGLLFNFGLPNAKAMTNEEIQDLIDQLLQQVAELQQQLVETGEGEEWCYNFNVNLAHGSTGSEVRALQIALEKQNLYQGESDYFDEQVASAVTGFQERYREDVLASWGLSYGTGYVGNTTRAKLNELYGCEEDDDSSDDYLGTSEIDENFPPVIDGLEAPTLLRVGSDGICQQKVSEEGSWTIRAHDPESGSLTYSVNWGDGSENEQQAAETATFTHSYNRLGTYTIDFVVIDNEQQKTEVSIIIKVVSEVDSSYSFWSHRNSIVDDTELKVDPEDVILSGDWEETINNLYQKFPDANNYIGKIEYYFKDAIADERNSIDGKMADDTTAYRGGLRMMSVLQSFETVQKAGYGGDFSDFCSNCSYGYSHLRGDIYKIVDGVPTKAPGSRVYDRIAKIWYVWDEWAGSARIASDTEVRIFDMIDNQVSDAGDGELNMIKSRESGIRSLNELIKTYEDRIEITLSGGRVSDTWGDLEYLRDHVEQFKKDIAKKEAEIDEWEEKLNDVLKENNGIGLSEEWRDDSSEESSEDSSEEYVPEISDSDEFWKLMDSADPIWDYSDYINNWKNTSLISDSSFGSDEIASTDDDDNNNNGDFYDPNEDYVPEISDSDEYYSNMSSDEFWDSMSGKDLEYKGMNSHDATLFLINTDTVIEDLFLEEVSTSRSLLRSQDVNKYGTENEFWLIFLKPIIDTIEFLETEAPGKNMVWPDFFNNELWRDKAYNYIDNIDNNNNDDDNGYPATPGETGGVPSDKYKDFWNAVDPVSDYPYNNGDDDNNDPFGGAEAGGSAAPRSDSDEYYSSMNDDNDDDNGYPATPGETGGVPSDDYKDFLNALPF